MESSAVKQTRLFVGVVIIEIVVIAGLWAFGWYFGA
jgi:uncharacterized BrkB/YihY/UPF0761 family membrane protein